MEDKEVGKVYVFRTTHCDMMNMNGAKCEFVAKDETDGTYKVKFIDHVVTVLPDELKEEVK